MKPIKLWIDDVREAPEDFKWHKTTDDAIFQLICVYLSRSDTEISLDHDAGEYAYFGGDYIEILKYLEEQAHTIASWKYWLRDHVTFHIHSMNPVGVQNMRAIIQKNGWKMI